MADLAPQATANDRARKVLAVTVWLAAIVGYAVFSRKQGLGPVEAAEELRRTLANNWWGPVLFVVVYVARPLVLFPAAVLTVLGGLAFGPWWGSFWTVVASNLSTATTYGVGRHFGSSSVAGRLTGLLGRQVSRATSNPFETTVVLRLLYVPFDAVGYVAGFLRLRYPPFALGSFLGTLPGTIAFVGFGASIESLDQGTPSFDLRVLAASVALAIAGSMFSRWLRRRERSQSTDPTVSTVPASEAP